MPNGTCWTTDPQAVNISALVTELKDVRPGEGQDRDGAPVLRG